VTDADAGYIGEEIFHRIFLPGADDRRAAPRSTLSSGHAALQAKKRPGEPGRCKLATSRGAYDPFGLISV
jgi:hypothetical protein